MSIPARIDRTTRRPRHRLLGAMLGMTALAQSASLEAAACLPGFCKFTETGKKGIFFEKSVDPAQLADNDATIAANNTGGALLAAQSINRGALKGTGLPMPQTEAALLDLVKHIGAGWTGYRAPEVTRVRIVGATTFNPEAHPDGVIVVPLGVLMRATNDDQIVWLLAHEYSHLALAHFAREARMKDTRATVDRLAMLFQTATDAAQHKVAVVNGKVQVSNITDPNAIALSNSVDVKKAQLEQILMLVGAFFSRAQEDQADVLGLDLAMRAGYSDQGAGQALDFIDEDDKRAAALNGSLQADFAAYLKLQSQRSLAEVSKGVNLNDVSKGFLDSLERNVGRMVLDRMITIMSAAHRPTDKRKEGINAYLDHAYPKLKSVKPVKAWLTALQSTQEYKEAKIAVSAHDLALDKLGAAVTGGAPAELQRARDAQAALKDALATRYASTPLIANASARIFEALKDYTAADRQYSLAEHLAAAPGQAPSARTLPKKGKPKAPVHAAPAPPPPPPDPLLDQSLEGFQDHVKLLVSMHAYPKALAVVGEAKRRFGDDTSFLPQLIEIYIRSNAIAQATDTWNRCMDLEDPALHDRCLAAMYGDEQQAVLDKLTPAEHAKLDMQVNRKMDMQRRSDFWKSINTPAKDETN